MRINGGDLRNEKNRNTGNEKKNKYNAPYIPKEVWNKMAPQVRKYHIEASNKDSPDQQSYGIQYGSKGPANYKKIMKGIKIWMVQLKRTIKTMTKRNMIKNRRIGTMKKIVLGISIEATKMHESIGDTSYVNET